MNIDAKIPNKILANRFSKVAGKLGKKKKCQIEKGEVKYLYLQIT